MVEIHERKHIFTRAYVCGCNARLCVWGVCEKRNIEFERLMCMRHGADVGRERSAVVASVIALICEMITFCIMCIV